MIFSIIALFLFVVLIVIIIAAVSIITSKGIKKDEKEKLNNSENFERVIRTIYFYLIMVILICIFVYSFIGVFNSLMNLLLPENVSETLQYVQMTKNSEIKNLITSATGIIVSLPIFWYCSRKIKNKEK